MITRGCGGRWQKKRSVARHGRGPHWVTLPAIERGARLGRHAAPIAGARPPSIPSRRSSAFVPPGCHNRETSTTTTRPHRARCQRPGKLTHHKLGQSDPLSGAAGASFQDSEEEAGEASKAEEEGREAQ